MMNKHLAILSLAAIVAACDANRIATDPQASLQDAAQLGGYGPRAVYTITNQVAGNAVAVFARATDGTLTAAGSFATGGTGTGASLGSQGSVAVSTDGQLVLAVNAASNDISVLRAGTTGLSLLSRTSSGGTLPISVTVSGNLVYVLNAGGAGNISGFTLDGVGVLTPIAGSTQPLSGSATDPAQVSFSPDGRQLVVTEKATNLIDVYAVDRTGVAGGRESFTSAGSTPFGFAFGPRKELLVTEAGAPGSASSYALNPSGNLRTLSGTVLTHQGAPCWAVITADGRFGYTGNGAGSVSGFSIRPNGRIELLDANGASAVLGGGVNDIALSGGSRFLYVLQVSNGPSIQAYRVGSNGSLTALGGVNVPDGARGLAAF